MKRYQIYSVKHERRVVFGKRLRIGPKITLLVRKNKLKYHVYILSSSIIHWNRHLTNTILVLFL